MYVEHTRVEAWQARKLIKLYKLLYLTDYILKQFEVTMKQRLMQTINYRQGAMHKVVFSIWQSI